jgi:cytochrome c oxidase accessory protein FixG
MSTATTTPRPDERVLSTLNEDGTRRWLEPRTSRGAFWRRRRGVAYALIALFVALPFVRIEGRPALLLDLGKREFSVLGATYFSNDTVLLMLFLLSTFVGIFLLTALFGRAWCGWACPQTVYLEWVFRPLERWLQPRGTRPTRARRAAKYGLYAVLALALAHVFLGYFVRVEELAGWLTGSPTAHWGSFLLVVVVAALIFVDFAYFREQLCVVACPYARLQSGLLDAHSLIVGYDAERGEPRGKPHPKLRIVAGETAPAADEIGDCIDCKACVATCPTGIDIRQGLQLECIACTQCIDACDAIMDRLGKPRGLVGYTSKARLARTDKRGVRVRLLAYPAVLAILGALLLLQLDRRQGTELSVIRTIGQPFRELPDGRIANSFKLRIRNRDGAPHTYALALLDAPGLELVNGSRPVEVQAREHETLELFVAAPRAAFASGDRVVEVSVTDLDDRAAPQRVTMKLLGPSAPQRSDP